MAKKTTLSYAQAISGLRALADGKDDEPWLSLKQTVIKLDQTGDRLVRRISRLAENRPIVAEAFDRKLESIKASYEKFLTRALRGLNSIEGRTGMVQYVLDELLEFQEVLNNSNLDEIEERLIYEENIGCLDYEITGVEELVDRSEFITE